MTTLASFLTEHKVKRNEPYTHTSIIKGSYNVPPGKTAQFYRLYRSAVKAKIPIHLTEKHLPDRCMILIDLDMRKKLPFDKTRMYPPTLALAFIKLYIRHLSKYVNTVGARFYVMEKPAGRKDKDVFKDGLHIVCPDVILAPHVQLQVRLDTLADMETTELLAPYIVADSTASDCFDEAVIKRNNWFLYGSSKAGQPAYTVTGVYRVVGDDVVVEPVRKSEDFLTLFSIRGEAELTPLKIDFPAPQSAKSKDKPQRPTIDAASDSEFLPLKVLEAHLMFLSATYWGNTSYEVWKRIVIIAAILSEQFGYPDAGADLIHYWSAQWIGYDQAACDTIEGLIKAARTGRKDDDTKNDADDKGPITLATLKYYVKLDYLTRMIKLVPKENRANEKSVLRTLIYLTGKTNSGDYKDLWTGDMCNGTEKAWIQGCRRMVRSNDGRALYTAAKKYNFDATKKLCIAYLEVKNAYPLPAPTSHDKTFDWNAPGCVKYDLPKGILPLDPNLAIQVTVAGMGVGKTKAVIDLLDKLIAAKSDLTVLFLTHNRNLSTKLAKTYPAHMQIVNYLDRPRKMYPSIDDERIVLCFDSLCRAGADQFDLVIIDECKSVLPHVHSDLMASKDDVCARFMTMLSSASRIVLLDAYGDNKMIQEFVKELYELRERIELPAYMMYTPKIKRDPAIAQEPRWFFNTWIRDPLTHTFNIYVNNDGCWDYKFRKAHIDRCVREAKAGKRLIIPCSNKSQADDSFAELRRELPHLVVLIYTVDTPPGRMKEHMEDVNTAWKQADIIIYSPAIGPGVSFEVENHFHMVIAMYDNSMFTADADTCIQQSFRVRNLIDKTYVVFVSSLSDFEGSIVDPCKVEKMLEKSDNYIEDLGIPSGVIHSGVEYKTDNFKRIYQKKNVFYPILKYHIINRNLSQRQFVDRLSTAFKDDRGGIVTVDTFSPPEDDDDGDEKEVKLAKPKSVILDYRVPSRDEYVAMKRRFMGGEEPTPEEKQQVFNYNIGVDVYGIVPERLCGSEGKAFVELYVGPQAKNGAWNIAHDKFHKFDMLYTAMQHDVDHIRLRICGRVEWFKHLDEGAGIIPFHMDHAAKAYIKGFEAAKLLVRLFPNVDPFKVLKDGATACIDASVGQALTSQGPHTIAIKTKDLHEGLMKYIEAIGTRNKGSTFKLFDYNGNKSFDTPRSKTEFVKAVLFQGLGLSCEVIDKHPRNTFMISAVEFFHLVDTYLPGELKFFVPQVCTLEYDSGVDDV